MKKLIVPILITLALPLVFQSTPTEILKLKTFDALVKEQEPSGNFVILNISESDVRERGGFPFPRRDLAQIQIDLINEGAIGVGWAMSFSEADRFGGDDVFAQALSFAPSVLAMFETPNGQYPKTVGTVIKGNEVGGIPTQGIVENINILKEQTYQGIATAPVDIDNLVRRIPLLMKTPDGWSPSFGTEILKALTETRSYIITTNDNGIQEIAVRHLPPIKTDNFGRKWVSWVDTPQTTLEEMKVAGKFVIIGVTANGVMPQVATPVGLLEPHKIQAALAESILLENSPIIPDWSLAAEILIFTIIVSLTWLLINYLGMTLGIALAILTMLCTAFIMNKVLTAQVDAVQKHGGLVDKFIGDAGMYIFNAPLDVKHHEQIAFECALDIIKNIKVVNQELKAEGMPSIAIGIGLNTGDAIVGNMGSNTRFDYSAIGDAVNIAARLESATKERGVDILIGEETEKFCGYSLKVLESIKVKGKEKPLKIYTTS